MPGAIDKAIKEFSRLPGIGNKSAQRLVYFLLRGARAHADQLAAAINSLTADVHPCKVCGMLTELETCEICQDTRRDDGMICVVEESGDVPVVEASGRFRGRYHVLGGLISPINQVFPEQLNVAPLKTRASGVATEVILALSASSDGEYTSRYLAELLKPLGITVTSLARGIPSGAALEFADKVTLGYSLDGRVEL